MDGAAPPGGSPRFGVVVPCRNEAAVVERRIRNLARLDWPASDRPHRVVVVDDGSTDGTAAAARAALADLGERGDLAIEVLANPGPHGKAHAMALAIDALGDVDLLLLTDADVVFERRTPLALADAFAADDRLAMASGSQRFHGDLRQLDDLDRRDDGYDRWTARVRRLESRLGVLFSVHGQCLCWRADLGLRPTPGFAADDLDLRQQARARGGRIRLVEGAIFREQKIAEPEVREAQALRRAEAFFQFVRRTPHGPGPTLLDHLQWAFYRWVPVGAPLWLAALAVLAWLALDAAFEAPSGSIAAIVLTLVLSTLFWSGHVRYLTWIWRASRSERRRSTTDSWETARA